jgi:putative membrane protein insertion efficiency factor
MPKNFWLALPKNIVCLLIKLYQLLSYWKPAVCRFQPSCSVYALEAFQVHGLWRGFVLTFKRLALCHPWHAGGYDPVKPKKD